MERKYEWTWLYAAVEPSTGESLCPYLPRVDGICFEAFLEHLGEAYPEEHLSTSKRTLDLGGSQ